MRIWDKVQDKWVYEADSDWNKDGTSDAWKERVMIWT